MSMHASKVRFLAGCVLACVASSLPSAQIAAQTAPPDFSVTGWLNNGTFEDGELIPVDGSPLFSQDPARPFISNQVSARTGQQPTFRIADLSSNPNVKPWAKEVMKKDNDEVIAGKIAYTARSFCRPGGVPGFNLFGFQPMFFLQTPKKVTIIYSGDQQVRHVYLDVPHSANVKPSWYGESVGRYEGDTLVIDTIGLNTKTHVDNFRTPHTEKLHVVERWKLVEDGQILEVTFTVDDPDTYYQPWSAKQRYRRAQGPMTEQVCVEGNLLLFDWDVAVDDQPDF
jgi:hypothetical protein